MDHDIKKEPLTDDMQAPPAYAYTMEGPTCTQPLPAPLSTPVTVSARGEGWSPLVFAMSLCSIICCGVFGVAATAMSIMAYVDHKFNDLRMVAHRQRKAKVLLTCAIFIGLLCLSLLIVRAYLENERSMDDDDDHPGHGMHHQHGGNNGMMHHGSYGSRDGDMGGMHDDMMHDQ